MPKKVPVSTPRPPVRQGTYTQAVRCGDLVFVTGQTGRNPETGELEEGLERQTRRTLANVDEILAAAGCSAADVVRVTLMLADIADFKAVDAIYAEWLPDPVVACRPARTAFAAAALPAGALLEMEVVAAVGGGRPPGESGGRAVSAGRLAPPGSGAARRAGEGRP